MRRSAALIVFSDIGRRADRSGGNRNLQYRASDSIPVMMSKAWRDSGTRCSWRIFILCAGIDQTGLSKSNSFHSAWRSSPGRTNTLGSNFKAEIVTGWPSKPSIARSTAPTSRGVVIAALWVELFLQTVSRDHLPVCGENSLPRIFDTEASRAHFQTCCSFR